MKRIICWLLGHEDKPLEFIDVPARVHGLTGEIRFERRRIVYSYKCVRCRRVREYER